MAGASCGGAAGLGLENFDVGSELKIDLEAEVVAEIAGVVAEVVLATRSFREASQVLGSAHGEGSGTFIIAAHPAGIEIEAVVERGIWVAMEVAKVEMEGGLELPKIGFFLAVAGSLAGGVEIGGDKRHDDAHDDDDDQELDHGEALRLTLLAQGHDLFR